VGLGERLRAWLRGEDTPDTGAGPYRAASDASMGDARSHGDTDRAASRRRVGRRRGRAQHPSSGFDSGPLVEFARSRRGVEVYLEPRTRLYGHSVLLVADDGEYLRRPVPDIPTVHRFCSEHGIPVYDAARTGYPRRVRDYDRGLRPGRIELDDLPPWPTVTTSRGPESEGRTSGRLADVTEEPGEQDPPPPPAPTGD